MGQRLQARHLTAIIFSDSQLLSDALCRMLREDHGIEIVETSRTDALLSATHAATQPDIALLILANPTLDTAQLGLQVRKRFHASKLLIISTIQPTDVLFRYFMRARPDAYLDKDCGVEDLATALQVVDSGGIWLPAGLLYRDTPREDEIRSRLSLLTSREHEVLRLVLQGYSNGEIAEYLFISQHTVKGHLQRIFDKMGVSRRSRLIVLASQPAMGTLPPLTSNTKAPEETIL